MKKFRKSPIAIISYVIAALLLVYFCTVAVSTVNTINEYYAQYGMSAPASEVISYIFQQGVNYLIFAVIVFLEGFILDTVRKLDPANWVSDEEAAAAKAAKKAEKAANEVVVAEEAVEVAEEAVEEAAEEVAEEAEEVVEEAVEVAEETVAEAEEVVEEAVEAAEEVAEEAEEVVAEVVEEVTEDFGEEPTVTIVEDTADVAEALKATFEKQSSEE